MPHEETWIIRKPAVESNGGIVTAQHHVAARVGADVLARGGNAVDAAIATAFALATVEPWMSGLGGCGFMVVHLASEKRTFALEFGVKAKRAVFKPNCRLMFGLKNKNYFSSSMDSSDGLSTTLNEMSSQSKKRFVITRMPSENDVFDFASSSRLNVDDLILNGGEEYEIVATVNVSNLPKIKKYAKKHRMKLYEIGYVTKGKGVFYKKNGRLIRIKDKGWQHLQKS